MTGLRIRTLGALEIEVAGAAVVLPPGRRVRGLLAWLGVHPGRHPRSRLAGWLWPEVPDPKARANLRSALWSLRAALGPAGSRFLASDRQWVSLREDGVWVDAAGFTRLADAGRLTEAAALCRGELLPELDDDWVFEAREAHSERMAQVLAALAARAAAGGDPRAALSWARRRAAVAPLDEAAGRELISCFAATGDIPRALAAYDRLRRRLGTLGVLPSRETRRLAARLRAARSA